MAAYEILLLNTAVPQIQAAQSGDTYVVPRDIAFSAALTLSAGTANGVAYLNGSKVLTTGSALTFDGANFEAVNATSAQVAAVRGSQRIVIGADGFTNAYVGTTTAHDVSFLRSGSEQMRLTSTSLYTASGINVGIGTSSLQSGTRLTLQESASNPSGLAIRNRNSTQTWQLSVDAAAVDDKILAFIDPGAGVVRMALDSSGNLGLGVTPSAWGGLYKTVQVTNSAVAAYNSQSLAVVNNAYDSGVGAWIYSSSAAASFYNQSSGIHAWYTAPSGTAGNAISFTQAMTLDASGNLGVGATSPDSKLVVQGSSGTYAQIKDGTVNTFIQARSADSVGVVGTLTNHGLAFWTNSTERARITSGGDLLVGTTSASTQITFVGGSGITYQRSTDNSFPGVFDYLKSRGSVASPTAVQNGDGLFLMRVAPYHGSAYTYLNSMTVDVDGTFTSGQNPPTRIAWYTNAANGSSTERARITSVGNFKIGGSADRATTEGTNQLVLFNGTAPVGTLTNGVSFYSASGEARVMDAAGNSTLLSPHDQSTNEWIFHSKHTPTGKVLRIDVERLLKFVNDHFGLDAVHEFIEE